MRLAAVRPAPGTPAHARRRGGAPRTATPRSAQACTRVGLYTRSIIILIGTVWSEFHRFRSVVPGAGAEAHAGRRHTRAWRGNDRREAEGRARLSVVYVCSGAICLNVKEYSMDYTCIKNPARLHRRGAHAATGTTWHTCTPVRGYHTYTVCV